MNIELSNTYGKDYLQWKEWGKHCSFGELDESQRAYYRAELRNTKLELIRDVLEIGFGNGSFLAFCKENSWNTLGTEMNPELVTLALERGFQAVDANRLVLAEAQSWDLIVAFDVLEHVDQSKLIEMLVLIRQLLRPGGVFVARFPNGDSPLGLQLQHGDITHLTTLGSGKVEYFAKTLEYEIVSLRGAVQPIFRDGFASTLRRLLIVPLKNVLELLIKKLFFPGTRVAFLSPSLVVCLPLLLRKLILNCD